MQKEDLANALRTGGASRDAALAFIFKDSDIKNGVSWELRSYREQLERQLPSSAMTMGGKRIRTYVDFFLVEAVFELDKSIRYDNFKGVSYGEIFNFLKTTAYRKCRDTFQKMSESPTDILPEGASMDASELENNEKKHVLHAVLAKLGRSCAEILLLFYSGYSYEEIAPKLKLANADTAKATKANCFKSLKGYLTERPELANFFKNAS